MIVLGASRHAKEILQILKQNKISVDFLFDNFSATFESYFDEFSIIKSLEDPRLKTNETFVLGLGGTVNRKKLFNQCVNMGLTPKTVISSTSVVGTKNVHLGIGLNIMHFSFISDAVCIGDGTLINAYGSVHHDVKTGSFSEISPKATVLGGATVGDLTSIGAGAIILPNIRIGNKCIIGAGAVVTKNVGDSEIWYGNPAKFVKNKI